MPAIPAAPIVAPTVHPEIEKAPEFETAVATEIAEPAVAVEETEAANRKPIKLLLLVGIVVRRGSCGCGRMEGEDCAVGQRHDPNGYESYGDGR